MYVGTGLTQVAALDARTGEQLGLYDLVALRRLLSLAGGVTEAGRE